MEKHLPRCAEQLLELQQSDIVVNQQTWLLCLGQAAKLAFDMF